MLRALSLLLLIASIYFLGFLFFNPVALGNKPVGSSLTPTLLMTLFTFIGVYSRSVFQNLTTGAGMLDSIKGREFFITALVAPVALLAVYNLYAQIHDLFLLSLLSYQNGFFVENVTSYVATAQRQRTKSRPKPQPRELPS